MLSTSKRSYFTVAVKYSKGSFPFTKFFFASCHNGYIINLQPTFEKCIFETLFKARFWFVSTWVFAKSASHHFICVFFFLKKKNYQWNNHFYVLDAIFKIAFFLRTKSGMNCEWCHTGNYFYMILWFSRLKLNAESCTSKVQVLNSFGTKSKL